MLFSQFIFVLSLFFIWSAKVWACASCGCTLSPNFENPTESGWMVDLRYDYINQNQLRSGTSKVSSTSASQMVSNGNPQEVENFTENRYITASAEYTINSSWRVTAVLPYIVRSHSTDGQFANGVFAESAESGQYTSNTSSFGDARLIGRFQGFNEAHNYGVLLGVKLPTGNYGMVGTSTDPNNPGSAPIDRGLQPGTGTFDVIFGAYFAEALDKNWDLFAEGFYQTALDSADQYRPGDSLNLNGGGRYMGFKWLYPQLQLNGRYVAHDTGANSDTISTGGTLLYFSPGLTVPVVAGTEVYAFFQVPVYQNLLGVQLAPTYTASLGARYYF